MLVIHGDHPIKAPVKFLALTFFINTNESCFGENSGPTDDHSQSSNAMLRPRHCDDFDCSMVVPDHSLSVYAPAKLKEFQSPLVRILRILRRTAAISNGLRNEAKLVHAPKMEQWACSPPRHSHNHQLDHSGIWVWFAKKFNTENHRHLIISSQL